MRTKKTAWGIKSCDLSHGRRLGGDAAERLFDLLFYRTSNFRPRFGIILEGFVFPVVGKFFMILEIFSVTVNEDRFAYLPPFQIVSPG